MKLALFVCVCVIIIGLKQRETFTEPPMNIVEPKEDGKNEIVPIKNEVKMPIPHSQTIKKMRSAKENIFWNIRPTRKNTSPEILEKDVRMMKKVDMNMKQNKASNEEIDIKNIMKRLELLEMKVKEMEG